MKVKEFVNYIKDQTGKDWEELAYHIMQTLVAEQNWKDEVEKLGETVTISHPLMMITHCAMEMGWDIAIPKDKEGGSGNVEGLIVGKAEYIDSVLKSEVDDDDEEGDEELPEGSEETPAGS